MVGELTVTGQELPDPVMAGRILGFRAWKVGAFEPSSLPSTLSLSDYLAGYLGIGFHNDTQIAGTSAEVDPKRGNGPFEIELTMDGEPWWTSEVFFWKPCESDTRDEVAGRIHAPMLPGLGSHTLVASLLWEGMVLDTQSISFTVVE